jgi:hypothetical protein
MEPTTESLKDAAANVYDDLKEIGGDFADQAEEYLEELFPGVAQADTEDKDEDSDAARVEEDVLDSSKPLEHVDDDADAVNRQPAIVTTTTTQIPEFAKSHGHHKNKNGTHHRPGHNNKHNSTHGNDTDAPVFEPERYFTEPIITGLLVSFLIFIPLVAMGIAALSSIQVSFVTRFTRTKQFTDIAIASSLGTTLPHGGLQDCRCIAVQEGAIERDNHNTLHSLEDESLTIVLELCNRCHPECTRYKMCHDPHLPFYNIARDR